MRSRLYKLLTLLYIGLSRNYFAKLVNSIICRAVLGMQASVLLLLVAETQSMRMQGTARICGTRRAQLAGFLPV